MSHFTVLVIGADHEAQLAPYHQFECTGENDEYVQDVDVTQEMNEAIEKGESIEDALGYYGLEDKIVDDESKVEKVGDECAHKYGYAIVKDGKLIKAVNRTNPNKKWDWYLVGGRWSGLLKLKAGGAGGNGKRSWMNRNDVIEAGYCDQAKKGDIDFDAMRDKAGIEAAEAWDKAYAVHQGQTWEPWKVVGPRTGYDDAARNFYSGQPAVQALRKVLDNPFHDIDQYQMPRDEFVQAARDRAIVTFAVVKNSTWYEKGEMGWWGAVSNKKEQTDWNRQFNELLDGLPDDTVLTVVDCHI
jgi:hypothetical protein